MRKSDFQLFQLSQVVLTAFKGFLNFALCEKFFVPETNKVDIIPKVFKIHS